MSAVAIPPLDMTRPLSRDEYEKMASLGMFQNERLELIHGFIVRMSPIGPPHNSSVQRLGELFIQALVPRVSVRIQASFVIGDSQPEPDVAVVPRSEYRDHHPSQAFFIVEVAESSLTYDRATKAALYASAGVPEYWVVNLVDGLVEVHTDIVRGAYTRVVPHRTGASITPAAFPDVSFAVADIL